jgi:hypothetical protein
MPSGASEWQFFLWVLRTVRVYGPVWDGSSTLNRPESTNLVIVCDVMRVLASARYEVGSPKAYGFHSRLISGRNL